jgi:hypothetical protein
MKRNSSGCLSNHEGLTTLADNALGMHDNLLGQN